MSDARATEVAFTDTLASFGSYDQERADFLAQAERAGAEIRRYFHPRYADLSTDVAVLRGEVATASLILVSGTHGIEGHAGSAIQREFLRGVPAQRLVDTIVVHGLNPYGLAHERRVDDNNVDVNRNFVDFDNLPSNTDYSLVHDLLVPEDWKGPAHDRAQRALLGLLQEKGLHWLQSTITRGQYTHPNGLFFGGDRPSWSNETLCEIVASLLQHPQHVGYIDLHTGLGRPGEGEPIFRGGTDPGAYDRACRWYGNGVTRSEDGTSSSTSIAGNTAKAVRELLPESAMLTAITLEFGTLDAATVLAALQGDNWFGHVGKRSGGEYLSAREEMRAAFAPRDPIWQRRIITRGLEIIRMAEQNLFQTSFGGIA